MSSSEKESALLQGLRVDSEMITEAIVSVPHTYEQAVAKLMVREVHSQKKEYVGEKPLVTHVKTGNEMCNCYNCVRVGQITRKYRQKKKTANNTEQRVCFKCGEKGHISRNCQNMDEEENESGTKTAMLMIPSALVTAASFRQSGCWMLDSASNRHLMNNTSHLCDFTPCDRVVQVGNNKTIKSYGCGGDRLQAVVNDVKHLIVLHDLIYELDIMFNFISVSKVLRKNYRIIFDTDDTHSRQSVVKLLHNGSVQTRMSGIETPDSLYEAVQQEVDGESACAMRSFPEKPHIWRQRLGHDNDDVIAESLSHVRSVEKEVGPTSDCDTCA